MDAQARTPALSAPHAHACACHRLTRRRGRRCGHGGHAWAQPRQEQRMVWLPAAGRQAASRGTGAAAAASVEGTSMDPAAGRARLQGCGQAAGRLVRGVRARGGLRRQAGVVCVQEGAHQGVHDDTPILQVEMSVGYTCARCRVGFAAGDTRARQLVLFCINTSRNKRRYTVVLQWLLPLVERASPWKPGVIGYGIASASWHHATARWQCPKQCLQCKHAAKAVGSSTSKRVRYDE